MTDTRWESLLNKTYGYIESLPNPELFWDWVLTKVSLASQLRLRFAAALRYRDMHLLEALVEIYQEEKG